MKRVFSSYNAILVHHARNLLEAEGIETEVRNQMLSSAMGELPPAECQAELWVLREEDAGRAEQVLRRPAPSGADWRCADCGEVSGPQFTQCWKCGATRPRD
jgi:Putative prokaryotic signal transducing protein